MSIASVGFGSISAWAEASSYHCLTRIPVWVYLRVGGGIWKSRVRVSLVVGLSPRGRRHHPTHSLQGAHHGSISAWAEASGITGLSATIKEVYLRVGGGIV